MQDYELYTSRSVELQMERDVPPVRSSGGEFEYLSAGCGQDGTFLLPWLHVCLPDSLQQPWRYPRRLPEYRALQSLRFRRPHSIGTGRGQKHSVIQTGPHRAHQPGPSAITAAGPRPPARLAGGWVGCRDPGWRSHRRPDRGRTLAGTFHPDRRNVVRRLFVAHRASCAQNGRSA